MLLGVLIRVKIIIFSGEDKALRFFSFGVVGAWYTVIEISELIIAVSSYVCSALNGFESSISEILLIYHFTLRRLPLLWSQSKSLLKDRSCSKRIPQYANF